MKSADLSGIRLGGIMKDYELVKGLGSPRRELFPLIEIMITSFLSSQQCGLFLYVNECKQQLATAEIM